MNILSVQKIICLLVTMKSERKKIFTYKLDFVILENIVEYITKVCNTLNQV